MNTAGTSVLHYAWEVPLIIAFDDCQCSFAPLRWLGGGGSVRIRHLVASLLTCSRWEEPGLVVLCCPRLKWPPVA